MVICLERDADLHMAQLMPLPLTVSCFSKIQIGFTFLVSAHLGSPGKRAVKRVCGCVCASITYWLLIAKAQQPVQVKNHFRIHWRWGIIYRGSMIMSGNEAWNGNVYKRWRKVDSDGADITLSSSSEVRGSQHDTCLSD